LIRRGRVAAGRFVAYQRRALVIGEHREIVASLAAAAVIHEDEVIRRHGGAQQGLEASLDVGQCVVDADHDVNRGGVRPDLGGGDKQVLRERLTGVGTCGCPEAE
jgi:hypothetical protein